MPLGAKNTPIDSFYQAVGRPICQQGHSGDDRRIRGWRERDLRRTEAAYNNASAHYWNKYVAESARGHGLSPFYWSTGGSPFDYTTGAITGQQVVTALTGGAAPPPPNGAPYAASGLTATAGNSQCYFVLDRRQWCHQLQSLSGNGIRLRGHQSRRHRHHRHILYRYQSQQRHYLLLPGGAANSSGLAGFSPKRTRRPPASTRIRRNTISKPTRKVGREAAVSFLEWRPQPRSTMRAGSRWR